MLDDLQRKAEAAKVWIEPWAWNGEFPIRLRDSEGFDVGGPMLPGNEPLALFWMSASPDVVLRLIAVARAAQLMMQAPEIAGSLQSIALRESLAALEAVGKKEGMDR